MQINEMLPALSFQATSGLLSSFQDFQGQWLVLYFYPKDATPGCTTEGQDFRDHFSEFKTLNCTVLGISRDTLKSHEKFKATQQFPFELISDTEEVLCQLFNVIKQKSMYGKQVRGIERSTFIIDPHGKLVHEWRKVSVANHVTDVLATLRSHRPDLT